MEVRVPSVPLLGPRSELERAHLERAQRRLHSLGLYPRPLDMRHVRVVHAPWLFRLPWFRRFHGYECGPLIFVLPPLEDVSNDLVTHELCHVWQDQHRRLRFWLSYLWQGYANNPHEVQARHAVDASRGVP
jgi:hypothetical protein